MQEIELSAGTIEYGDTAGSGPVVVLLHGLAMDSSVWSQVVQKLHPDYRCIVPTMPLGSHRKPMQEDADLSAPGIAKLVTELLPQARLIEITDSYTLMPLDQPNKLARAIREFIRDTL